MRYRAQRRGAKAYWLAWVVRSHRPGGDKVARVQLTARVSPPYSCAVEDLSALRSNKQPPHRACVSSGNEGGRSVLTEGSGRSVQIGDLTSAALVAIVVSLWNSSLHTPHTAAPEEGRKKRRAH